MTWMPQSAVPMDGTSQPTSTKQPQKTNFMPKSAVPVLGDTQQTNNGKSFSGFLGNLLGSAVNNVGNVVDATVHPIRTLKTAIQVPFGEGEVLASKLVGNPNNYNDPNMDMANAFNKNISDRYGSPQKAGDTLYNDPVGAALDASTVLDAGAGTVGRIADVSKLSALDKVATALSKASAATNPVNAAKAIPGATGWATKTLGGKVADAGESLPLRGLRPNPSQLTNFKATTGEDLGDFLKRNNVNGDFRTNAQNAIEDLQAKYDALAKDSKTSVSLKDIATQFKPIVQQWQQSLNPILKAKAEDIKGYLTAMAHKYGMDNSFTPEGISAADGSLNPDVFKGTVSINDLLNEKRELSDILKSSQFNSMTPEQAQLHTNLYHGLKGAINEATKKTDPNGIGVGPIGKEEQKWISLKNIADRQGNLGRGTQPLSLTGSILTSPLAYIGSALGGPLGALFGASTGPLVADIARNPKVIGAESRALEGTGNAMKKVGGMGAAIGASDKYAKFLQLLRNIGSLNQNTTQPYQGGN